MDDRSSLTRVLIAVGSVGLVAALTVAIAGWFAGDKLTRSIDDAITPLSDISTNVREALEASTTLVEQTSTAISGIETATRSTARALESANSALGEAGDLATGEIADGLEAAVQTLPGLVDTAGVVDTAMRAIAFLGVGYDPEVPLDVALEEVERTLRPIPAQIRNQAGLIEALGNDLTRIGIDGGELAAVLLETRISLIDVEKVLADAVTDSASAAAAVDDIHSGLEQVDTAIKVLAVSAGIALGVTAITPLLLGIHFRQRKG